MKTYIGVKMVEAEPKGGIVDRSVFDGKPWEPGYTDLLPYDPGYKVKYPDGYVSWCPKEQFERANFQLTNPDSISLDVVEKFISRIEVIDLDQKTTMVRAHLVNGFIITETSSCVDPENYSQEVGKDMCMSKITDKVWDYLGFLLCCAKNGVDGEKEN